VLTDRRGKLIAGNKIGEQARARGLEILVVPTRGDQLVVVQRTDLDMDRDPAARELAIADNRGGELGLEWDPEILDVLQQEGVNLDQMFTAAELDELASVEAPATGEDAPAAELIDRAAELNKKWKVKRGQVWAIGDHRLACGDATDRRDIALLFDGPIDAVITDPPYCSGGFQEAGKASGSIGRRGKHRIANDTLSTRGYIALLKTVLSNVGAGVLYIFTDWRMWINLFDVAESSGYGVRNMIVWDKGTPGMGQGWRSQHELILCAMRVVQPFDPHKAQGNVVQIARTGNVNHPTEKPVELIKTLLSVTDIARTIYDPFCGSGPTLIACEAMHRTGFAMDLDPKFCAVTLERLTLAGLKPELMKR